MKAKISPRASLLIITAIFIMPLAAAYLMYSGSIGYDPVETRNLGTLVEPPLPVDLAALEPQRAGDGSLGELSEHWVVLHHLTAPCAEACLDAVTGLRQVHRSTGRNQSRIRLLLVAENQNPQMTERLQGIYPGFYLALSSPDLAATLKTIPQAGEGSTYLIDPLGNIMMSYAAGFDPNDLKKDLKRLLTWSKLDEQ